MEERSYQFYINREFEVRKKNNSRYSLRAYAQYLGIDITSLSQILAGQRLLSFKRGEKFLDLVVRNKRERENFLLSLAKHHQEKNKKRLSPLARMILSHKIKIIHTDINDPSRKIDWEIFNTIADWYHYALLELTTTESFKSDPVWIARKLGISLFETAQAIKRLLQTGLMKRSDKNNVFVKTHECINTNNQDKTSLALKKRQKQILEKSLYSLEHDPISIRNHTAITMAVDPALLPEAKERIQTFMSDLCNFLESGHRKEVYELTINLFPLTKGDSL